MELDGVEASEQGHFGTGVLSSQKCSHSGQQVGWNCRELLLHCSCMHALPACNACTTGLLLHVCVIGCAPPYAGSRSYLLWPLCLGHDSVSEGNSSSNSELGWDLLGTTYLGGSHRSKSCIGLPPSFVSMAIIGHNVSTHAMLSLSEEPCIAHMQLSLPPSMCSLDHCRAARPHPSSSAWPCASARR